MYIFSHSFYLSDYYVIKSLYPEIILLYFLAKLRSFTRIVYLKCLLLYMLPIHEPIMCSAC